MPVMMRMNHVVDFTDYELEMFSRAARIDKINICLKLQSDVYYHHEIQYMNFLVYIKLQYVIDENTMWDEYWIATEDDFWDAMYEDVVIQDTINWKEEGF